MKMALERLIEYISSLRLLAPPRPPPRGTRHMLHHTQKGREKPLCLSYTHLLDLPAVITLCLRAAQAAAAVVVKLSALAHVHYKQELTHQDSFQLIATHPHASQFAGNHLNQLVVP